MAVTVTVRWRCWTMMRQGGRYSRWVASLRGPETQEARLQVERGGTTFEGPGQRDRAQAAKSMDPNRLMVLSHWTRFLVVTKIATPTLS